MSSILKVDQIQSDTGTVNISSNVVFSSGLTSGSAAAPSIFPTGDTNTGIFFPAADTIAFAEGGAEAMRIDSSGKVGIGTSSPNGDGTALHVNGSSFATLHLTNSTTGTSVSDGFDIVMDGSDVLLRNRESAAMKFATAGTERARITSGGNFFIGTTSIVNDGFLNVRCNANVFTPISVSSSASAGNAYLIRFVNNSGTDVGAVVMNGTNNGVAYSNLSDYRLKENVVPMAGALAKVLELNPVTFTWKDGGTPSQGFIAHELQKVVPDCVSGEKDAVDEKGDPKYQMVDTSFLVATLTAAIQELKAINDAQASRIETLEAKVSALESQ